MALILLNLYIITGKHAVSSFRGGYAMVKGLFDNTMSIIEKTLDLRATRHKLILSNVANIETPGYRAVDIKFEDELKKIGGAMRGGVLVTTNPGHLSTANAGATANAGTTAPRVIYRATDIEGYDKNSVGIDSEMAKLSENSLMYNASVKLLKSKFSTLMTAIKEGGK
ncbi:MAG: flagellar basal body rod protein FlgB [Deltaproteobacteria bacterium]|nr:flagellar basal body rod protein FlgB [Deltaproteobacteria bacterium]